PFALVLHSTGRGKIDVVACCREARRQGVRPGMLLAEAQSLWPASLGGAARFEPHDPSADRQALRELAVWCQQFSPAVALDDAEAPDCLLLDVSGCDGLPGGEEGLAGQAVAALRRRGYWAGAVVADTIGAAWAIAHGGLLSPATRRSPGQLQVVIVPSR